MEIGEKEMQLLIPEQATERHEKATAQAAPEDGEKKEMANIHASLERMRSSVFFKDDDHGWLPGHLIDKDENKGIATVLFRNEQDDDETKEKEVKIKLGVNDLSQSLLLQCVDDNGSTVVAEDMRDLPYCNEASIVYNLKERYQNLRNPYTRATSNVLVAINPYHWIDGLYSHDKRNAYSERIVWKNEMGLPPHLYETSSMALKGILFGDDGDQTIVVSGESGSGKTVSSKILMAHLATFHEQEYIPEIHTDEERAIEENVNINEEEKVPKQKKWVRALKINFNKENALEKELKQEKIDIVIAKSSSLDLSQNGFMMSQSKAPSDDKFLQDTNIIVQRVIDSNPLLEAFGNAKTCLNDNSSRFSRYSKLQFHVEDGLLNPIARIAGSTCHTFLLEKSRVVSHASSNDERTFHIFYQLMQATTEEKERIWSGLVGKSGSSFKYIGDAGDSDEYTDHNAWKNTISALNTIGVKGEDLQKLLAVVCIILQLGNLIFRPNPVNEDDTIITNDDELQMLSQLLGIERDKLSYCFTHKNMTTNRETFEIPLKVADAKSTCDAFAKECYRAMFDWLVEKTNKSTCADKNYKDADKVTRYKCISILDICGFECFNINGFEQLLINHTNERLQKTFTETVIDGVIEEYELEGVPIEKIAHNDNDGVIKFLEGKMGLISLLNEQCLLPKASDSAFVQKVYATHEIDKPASKLFFMKHFQLEKNPKNIFGIKHFARDVVYDATGFVMKNKDTIPFDVIKCATQSSNNIISSGLQLHESSTPKKKSALIGTTLWSSFERQMTSLFIQIKQTKIWFVRCIIPNKKKLSFALDLKYAHSQLRSVGVLSALEMSHASFPNKQKFKNILRRFWLLEKADFNYCFDIISDDSIKDLKLRDYCHQLLQNLFRNFEPNSAYVLGRTKVYFRAGSLEHLEAERSKVFDKSATKIQARIRGIRDRKLCKRIKKQSKQEKEVVVSSSCGRCIIQ